MDGQSPNNSPALSPVLNFAPLILSLILLIVTTILWYHFDWTVKETIFNFSVPVALLLISFIVTFVIPKQT